MLSFRFAIKNLIRNFRYTVGLFIAFLITSALCLSFFLFSAMTNDAYQNILSKRASTAYVSLTFGYNDSQLFDLTSEQKNQIEHIDNVHGIEKFTVNFGAKYLLLNDRKQIREDIGIISTQSQNIPAAYKTEFSALYDGDLLLCGREINTNATTLECLISESVVSLVGAESAEELLEQSLTLTDLVGEAAVQNLAIVGIIRKEFSDISAMENESKYFVFVGNDSLNKSSIGMYKYVLFSDYVHLSGLRDTLEDLAIENTKVSIGNDSYSMKKLAETSEFISAILVLIAILCLAACITFITGMAMFKFSRNRLFYYAAFSVGFSKKKLMLSFLFEFLIVSFAAFAISIPISVGIINSLANLMAVFTRVHFNVKYNFLPILYSAIPIAFAAIISMIAIHKKIVFEKTPKSW